MKLKLKKLKVMIRNILLIAAISLTTGLFASNPVAMKADVNSGSKIQGKVQSFVLQDALSQAQVVVYSETSDIIKVTTTNSKGEFTISDLPEGMYYISISHLGYKPVIIDNIQVGSDEESVSLKDMSMESNFYKIKEVVVTAQRICKDNSALISSIVE